MDQAAYSRRSNLFEKGDWMWAVTEAGIAEVDPRGRECLIRWDDIERVRLDFSPTRYKPWRYLMELKLESGGKLSVDNAHFKGIADFEDRSGAYRPFVEAVLEELRSRRPDVKVRIGSSPGAYWTLLAFAFGSLGLLAIVLLMLPGSNVSGAGWVKLGIIAIGLPVLFQWARKSYPRAASLHDIPGTALPRAA